jgi:hypothetical protein
MGSNRRAQKRRVSEQRPDAHGIGRQDAALMLIVAVLALSGPCRPGP